MAKTMPLWIRAARLIDGTGQAPVEDACVCVDTQGVITYAGPAEQAPVVRPDARTVDLGGRTILPGFIDTHVHLGSAHGTPPGMRAFEDPVLRTFDTADRLGQTLDAGITTARDLGGLPSAYRVAVESGRVRGPRLQTAVRVLSHTGGHGDFRLPDGTDLSDGIGELVDTVDEARLGVRRVLRAGADLVKVCATGGMGSPYDDPDDQGLSTREIAAVVDEANRHGEKRVAAHAQGKAGILNAIRGGVTSIEHGYGLDEACCDLAGERHVFVVPTLSTVYAGIDKNRMPDYHYQKKVRWSGITKENIARAIDRGVPLAMGTDAAVGPHGRNLMELVYLADLGMTPMAAIVAGTRSAAELLGIADRLGTVEQGKLADLVACAADPLGDIRVLGEPANIVWILQGGIERKNLLNGGASDV